MQAFCGYAHQLSCLKPKQTNSRVKREKDFVDLVSDDDENFPSSKTSIKREVSSEDAARTGVEAMAAKMKAQMEKRAQMEKGKKGPRKGKNKGAGQEKGPP